LSKLCKPTIAFLILFHVLLPNPLVHFNLEVHETSVYSEVRTEHCKNTESQPGRVVILYEFLQNDNVRYQISNRRNINEHVEERLEHVMFFIVMLSFGQ